MPTKIINCPACSGTLERFQAKSGLWYWRCASNDLESECSFITKDNSGEPASLVTREPAEDKIRCPVCQGPMNIIQGSKYGAFMGCRHKECKGTRDLFPDLTVTPDCPDCGRPMRIRKGKSGPFLGCSGYPDACQTTKPIVVPGHADR